jgi:hypothetical protein
MEMVQLEERENKFLDDFIISLSTRVANRRDRIYEVARCTEDKGNPSHYDPDNHNETLGCGIRHCMIAWWADGNTDSPSLSHLHDHVFRFYVDVTNITLRRVYRDGTEMLVFKDFSLFYLSGENSNKIPLGAYNSIFEFLDEYKNVIDRFPANHPLKDLGTFYYADYYIWKLKKGKNKRIARHF